MLGSSLFSVTSYFPAKPLDMELINSSLNSDNIQRAKESIKTIIASMTAGVDVSHLFPLVIRWMHVEDVELKKMVYLFIINNAHKSPEDSILVVNVLVKGATVHSNPIIRALSLRTMSMLRIPKVMEHYVYPLEMCLEDENSYVQKTAVLGVTKLIDYYNNNLSSSNKHMSAHLSTIKSYDENSDSIDNTDIDNNSNVVKSSKEAGDLDHAKHTIYKLLNIVKALLSKSNNPTVVSNCLACLNAIPTNSLLSLSDATKYNFDFSLTIKDLHNILSVIPNANEWSVLSILEFLSRARLPKISTDETLQKILPRLNHANSAIVICAIKIVLQISDNPSNYELATQSLIGLLSGPVELEWAALESIKTVLQTNDQFIQFFAKKTNLFLVKFEDPFYLKKIKTNILSLIMTKENYKSVIKEYKSYLESYDNFYCIECLFNYIINNQKNIQKEVLNSILEFLTESINDKNLDCYLDNVLNFDIKLSQIEDKATNELKLNLVIAIFKEVNEMVLKSKLKLLKSNILVNVILLTERYFRVLQKECGEINALLSDEAFLESNQYILRYKLVLSVKKYIKEGVEREQFVKLLGEVMDNTDFPTLNDQIKALNINSSTKETKTDERGFILDKRAIERKLTTDYKSKDNQRGIEDMGMVSSILGLRNVKRTFHWTFSGDNSATTSKSISTSASYNNAYATTSSTSSSISTNNAGDILSSFESSNNNKEEKIKVTCNFKGDKFLNVIFRNEDFNGFKLLTRINKNKLGIDVHKDYKSMDINQNIISLKLMFNENLQSDEFKEDEIEIAFKIGKEVSYYKVKIDKLSLFKPLGNNDSAFERVEREFRKECVLNMKLKEKSFLDYIKNTLCLNLGDKLSENKVKIGGCFIDTGFVMEIDYTTNVKLVIESKSEDACGIVENIMKEIVENYGEKKDDFDFLF
eukprot:GAHX01000409.1.p1 GENE.GAHX01000409.1~~GAHX01000409.1.p1  ORF type:complete len:938 (-),score=230.01 GAHX01000409.1:33-2813(-)